MRRAPVLLHCFAVRIARSAHHIEHAAVASYAGLEVIGSHGGLLYAALLIFIFGTVATVTELKG